ncbi:hypothetical protein HDU86_004602 [Geranomyces michiganensis]|nr:hypothetical protein HDU86_004602 [Geranomyces michiganensis]
MSRAAIEDSGSQEDLDPKRFRRSSHKHQRAALSPDLFAASASAAPAFRTTNPITHSKQSPPAATTHNDAPRAATDDYEEADSSFTSVTDETMQTLRSLAHFPPDPKLLASPRNPLSPPGSSKKKRNKRTNLEEEEDDCDEGSDRCDARSLVDLVLEDPGALLEQKKREWEEARVYLVETLAKLADAAHNYERPRLLARKQEEFESRAAILSKKDARLATESEKVKAQLKREAELVAKHTKELAAINERAQKLQTIASPPAVTVPQTRLPGTEL